MLNSLDKQAEEERKKEIDEFNYYVSELPKLVQNKNLTTSQMLEHVYPMLLSLMRKQIQIKDREATIMDMILQLMSLITQKSPSSFRSSPVAGSNFQDQTVMKELKEIRGLVEDLKRYR